MNVFIKSLVWNLDPFMSWRLILDDIEKDQTRSDQTLVAIGSTTMDNLFRLNCYLSPSNDDHKCANAQHSLMAFHHTQ